MTLIKNGAEGGTNGTDVTQGSGGNSGGASGQFFDLVSLAGSSHIQFSSAFSAHGSLAYKMVTNATDIQYLQWTPTVATSFALRFYIYLPSIPTAGNAILKLTNATGTNALLQLIVTNVQVQLQDLSGANVWNSGATLPSTNQWLRVELKGTTPSTSTGTLSMDWYVGDSTTPITGLSASLTGLNMGGSGIGQMRVGRTFGAGTFAAFYVDDLAYNDGATVYIGAATNTPPTVTVGSNQNVASSATVNLSATGSDTDGSIASYAWSFDYPTSGAPTLTGGTTATPSFTAGSAGNLYILRCTVTDDGGATGTATVEVRVPIPAGTAARHLAMDGTGTGTWTKAGGSATDGAALSDESDTTYVESPAVTTTAATRRVRLQPTAIYSGASFKEKLVTSTGTAQAVFKLYEGATVRQTWSAITATTTATETTITLDPATVAAITDYGNCYLELSVTS